MRTIIPKEIAAELGEGWSVTTQNINDALLTNGHHTLQLVWSRNLLVIKAIQPLDLEAYWPLTTTDKITVSTHIPASKVAAEIHRRLFPGYERDMAAAQERRTNAEAESQRIRAVSDSLIEIADGEVLLHANCECLRRLGALICEEHLQANTGSLVVKSDRVGVYVEVPHALAEQVLHLVLAAENLRMNQEES